MRRPLAALAALALGGAGAAAVGATHGAFSAEATNTGSSFGAAATFSTAPVDTVAPSSARSAAAKEPAMQTVGYVRPGQPARVYAQVTDGGTPTSGVSSVVAEFTGALGNVALTSQSTAPTVAGQTYNRASAATTVPNVANGTTYTSVLRMRDVAGNVAAPAGPTLIVDSVLPTRVNVSAPNSGSTVGRVEPGEVITFTLSEAIETETLITGWTTGTTSPGFSVTLSNGGGNNPDFLTFPGGLGRLTLGDRGYTSGTSTFTGSTARIVAGSGTQVQVQVTLGANAATALSAVTATRRMSWANGTLLDRAGNAVATTPAFAEPATTGIDF